MKKTYFLLLSAVIAFASCGPTTVVQSDNYANNSYDAAPAEDVSYQSFYDQLSPYGNWINYPGYGYVWMPNEGPDFRPYATNGNWIYTDAGWTWASNYNWGWAPFHYGRWFYENGYGWMWVPGNEWAPAWVSWRGGGDYYGWAPLGPRVSMDVALSNYNPPMNYWNFVPRQYMGNPGWHNYYVNESRNVTIINNTTIINNYSGTNRSRYAYAPGPDPNEVRRYSGNNFTQVQIRQSNRPGESVSGNQYTIYHPRVNANPTGRASEPGRPSVAAPAPARYQSFSNMRPTAQQPAGTRPQNPGMSQPAQQQPVNNPRPQNPNVNQPIQRQPVQQQPVNNPRPQNPNMNQPVQQQPVQQQPVQQQPVNNPRPQNPNINQPVQQQPVNNPRTAPAQPNNQLTQERIQNLNRAAVGAHPTMNPQNPHNQVTGKPVNTHNPSMARPVQRVPAQQQAKPVEKPVQQPKTREAN